MGVTGYKSLELGKTFKEALSSFMVKVCNVVSAIQYFLPQTLEAHIVITPKLGKDYMVCGNYGNYQPISPIHFDIKNFS